MKRNFLLKSIFPGTLFVFLIWVPSAFAQLDQYIGDSAIYSASSQYLRPNVLFIIDNNSTMGNGASTESYDNSETYTGSYEPWTIYKLTGQANYVSHINNSDANLSNVSCTAAKTALQAYGTYTGTSSTGLKSQGDCGNGGAGTVYLGNLLNFNTATSTGGEGASQIQIVRDAVTNVTGGARFGVNFGIMTFNSNNKGGNIIYPVTDLTAEDDYQAFLTAMNNAAMLSGETRPLAEALYDAGAYFNEDRTSTSLPISGASAQTSPITNWCQKNFVILVSNGDTIGDNDPVLGNTVGDFDGDGLEGSGKSYGNGTHYLDDVAKYLYENDLSSTLDGYQRLQTHNVQVFSPHKDLLAQAAGSVHGRGSYHVAANANELSDALTKVMANIVLEADTSFVAPVVPTSPENRTYSGERVYLGFFKPISQKPWHGNLKKYGINHQNQVVDKNGVVATLSDGSFSALATSFWSSATDAGTVEEGGAGEVLLNRNFTADPSDSNWRKIYTNRTNDSLTHVNNSFSTGTITADNLGVANDSARNNLINYIYGFDSYDDNGNGNATEKRDWIFGDILHSKPQIVNYNTYDFNLTNEADCNTNKTIIYVGTNDGLLHAFRDCDGGEEWAFIPSDLWPNLKELGERPAEHSYFSDASPVVYTYDKDNDGNIGPSEAADGDGDDGSDDKVVLIFGQRRGGNAYYALDVTDPTSPEYLWKIDSSTTGFGMLGQTWSEPNLGKVKFNDGGTVKEMIVAFVGAGYDNDNEDGRFGNTQTFSDTDVVSPTSDAGAVTSSGSTTAANLSNSPKGRGVYAFEIATLNSGVPTIANAGRLVWKFTKTESTSTRPDAPFNRGYLDYSVPSDISVLDTDFDGFVDRLYFGDTGGQLWRVSDHQSVDPRRPVTNPLINTWFGKRIFAANTASTNTTDKGRKIFFRPSVTYEPGGMIALYFGTGDRAHPLNSAVVDRIYAVFDKGQRTNEYIDEDNLINVTANELQLDTTNAATRTSILNSLSASSNYGWYIKLDRLNEANDHAGEKILASALAFNKVAYYTSYTPNATASVDPCSPGNLGISRLYAVNYKTGEAVLNFNNSTNAPSTHNDNESTTNNTRALSKDGKVLRRADRSVDLGIGIPSGLVVVMPPGGDAELLIGCGGGLCSEDPLAGGTIIPIYWMQW